MDLILWRHADAREADDGSVDADRPLTAKGERQAQRMAQWLNRHLPESTRVLVSPTLRTRQTADALARKSKIVAALAPEAPVEALLAAARWPDAREPVLIVGHQATLGLTAAYLLTGNAQVWAVRKGAVWWLRGRQRDTHSEVVLHSVLSPDAL
ncbi:MAG: phosphohistidine phosphatase SixA [Burkholderiales bacterium]|nr:phosphohistidine phosphatase SixA [Burkholderiales bacterium]